MSDARDHSLRERCPTLGATPYLRPGALSLEADLRSVLAGNAGPFTLDGTRTYIVGRKRVAVVDPGPGVAAHVRAVSSAVADAEFVAVLVTHEHADHADAAAEVARLTGAPVFGAGPVERPLHDGDSVQTDAGPLVAIETPGHAREHLCFHWPARKALFAGDLILGAGDTTWVAGYPGCVADYFGSLERLRSMSLQRIYPAHGEPIDDVNDRLGRFETHRRHRIEQVEAILRQRPDASRRQILERVYGPRLPPSLERAAFASLDAILDYLAGVADKEEGSR